MLIGSKKHKKNDQIPTYPMAPGLPTQCAAPDSSSVVPTTPRPRPAMQELTSEEVAGDGGQNTSAEAASSMYVASYTRIRPGASRMADAPPFGQRGFWTPRKVFYSIVFSRPRLLCQPKRSTAGTAAARPW